MNVEFCLSFDCYLNFSIYNSGAYMYKIKFRDILPFSLCVLIFVIHVQTKISQQFSDKKVQLIMFLFDCMKCQFLLYIDRHAISINKKVFKC